VLPTPADQASAPPPGHGRENDEQRDADPWEAITTPAAGARRLASPPLKSPAPQLAAEASPNATDPKVEESPATKARAAS
jgi:hypothetical protein